MEKTIREMITERSEECRKIDELGPKRASEILVELSSLLSSLNRETTEAHYWLNLKRVELLKEHKTVARAKMVSESLAEWKDWADRVTQGEAVEEMIRSLKYFLRAAERELKEFS